jgi:cysteinyl-tRNA synthetase
MIKGTTMSTKEQDLIMREQLEKAYEEEKLRSALIQRCYRIYHDFLQAKDE